ncbi:MAG: ATP-grasp domain-containing protein [Proteobacteria bacterium]|nr:ATP-grasp domain-containing protein [Pseudomonadota bacterium]MBU1581514.1 ATP-grasp domain-containing protein [Pseudomonadota bacterium]MBU2454613.1 ATP-grasp domain-containing protein [Pseudomonadota bacterium]MBU2628074.1 ATP-grasp domain-containing protein [Pseudomonadota bacterium]
MKKKVVILHNQLLHHTPDEVDVIRQRDLVKEACEALNCRVACHTVGNDLFNDMVRVKHEQPDIVFNLVEATWGKGELIYFAPAILNSLKIAYTGVPLDALFVTTNKVLAKKIMRFNHLPTADFFNINELDKLDARKTYIAKPIWEEASVGISADFIFKPCEKNKIENIKQLPGSHYFVEEFIDGREFNVSLLANEKDVEVLPPAEIIFTGYFDDKPKIVGYNAKWEVNSDEYQQTNRSFGTLKTHPKLKETLVTICRQSWKAFNLKGYARIDFRVDADDRPYVLEINGNPCIAPDSGFVAAIGYAGYDNEMMIKRILKDLN